MQDAIAHDDQTLSVEMISRRAQQHLGEVPRSLANQRRIAHRRRAIFQ